MRIEVKTGHKDSIFPEHTTLLWVGNFCQALTTEELATLVSCASAALAEQNSRVMSEAVCKCDLPEVKKYNVQPLRSPCAYFEPYAHQLLPLDDERVCVHCEHRRKCHSTHTTENQGE